MGAWGTAVFDNDDAADFANEIEDAGTFAEMRELLGVERSLADTCLGMRKYGLIQRVGRGKYIAAASSYNDRT